jgi:MFS family permease
MSALALIDWLDFSETSIAEMLAVAAMVTVSDNSLSFTAIAERAGPFWSGRALGVQNTTQLMVASVAQPVFGGLIGIVGYPTVFALCAVFPFAAIPLIPVEPKGHKEIHQDSK